MCVKLDQEIDTTPKFVYQAAGNSRLAQIHTKTGIRGKQLAWVCPKVTKNTNYRIYTLVFVKQIKYDMAICDSADRWILTCRQTPAPSPL